MEHIPFYTKLAQSVLRVKAAKRMLLTGETFNDALAAVQAEQKED
jgi:hypothetical protein